MFFVYFQQFGFKRTLDVFTYIIWLNFSPLFFPFVIYYAALNYCNFRVIFFGIYSRKYLPAWSCFRFHSKFFSFAYFFLSTSVACKDFNSDATAFLSSSNSFFLISTCHKTCFLFSSLTNFLCFFLYLRHQMNKCSTN